MAQPPDLIAGSATGSIFDLGYHGYDGPRLGRRHAISTLFVHSLAYSGFFEDPLTWLVLGLTASFLTTPRTA